MFNIRALPSASITLLKGTVALALGMSLGCLYRATRPNALLEESPTRDEDGEELVYDIVNAGPRNRFIALGDGGLVCLHNCLGLQYGMGVDKLSRKLTMDTGKEVSVYDATQLRDMHKRVFHVYWAWLDAVTNAYSQMPLTLHDGWTLFMDNPSALSVKNFPVQGTGSAIMRLAVRLAQGRGIKVSFPLHDAIYIIHDEGDTEAVDILEKCMDEAVETVLGKELHIRHEGKTVTNTDVWVEKRGESMYKLLKEYLEERETSPGEEKKLPKRRKKTASEKNA